MTVVWFCVTVMDYYVTILIFDSNVHVHDISAVTWMTPLTVSEVSLSFSTVSFAALLSSVR